MRYEYVYTYIIYICILAGKTVYIHTWIGRFGESQWGFGVSQNQVYCWDKCDEYIRVSILVIAMTHLLLLLLLLVHPHQHHMVNCKSKNPAQYLSWSLSVLSSSKRSLSTVFTHHKNWCFQPRNERWHFLFEELPPTFFIKTQNDSRISMDSSHHQIRSFSLPLTSINRHHLGRNLLHLCIKTFWQHPDSMLQSSLSKMMPQHLVRVAVFDGSGGLLEKRTETDVWVRHQNKLSHMRFIKGIVCDVRMILSVANGTSPCLSGFNWVWWMGIFLRTATKIDESKSQPLKKHLSS